MELLMELSRAARFKMASEFVQEYSGFFGVYMLCSRNPNPRIKGRIYIGFTVDPNRRINQHNKGHQHGGAKRTSSRGPWAMVLIVHGFPNNISALRFEWAWQKPKLSRRLKGIPGIDRRRKNESSLDYNFRILAEMLRTGPWNRLPLTVQWLTDEFYREFPVHRAPPLHMAIRFGRIRIRRGGQSQSQRAVVEREELDCVLCLEKIDDFSKEGLKCATSGCSMVGHMICLAKSCLEPGHFVPVLFNCSICEMESLWGDLIRAKNGFESVEIDPENTDVLEIGDVSEQEDTDD